MQAEEYADHVVGMWLDGNYTGEGTYTSVLEIAHECVKAYGDDAAYRLAGELREFVEQSMGDFFDESSLQTDLVGFMLSSVNWDKLAAEKVVEVSES